MSTMRSSDWRGDFPAAVRAVRHADVGEQQPEVVVDFGDGADRRARVRAGRLLLDGDGRRQAVDQVDVRLLHLLEELPGVGRQRLDVAPLAFGVDRVEGQRRLARPGQPGDDHQPVARDVDVDVLEVVDARAADRNPVVGHTVPPRISRGFQNYHSITKRLGFRSRWAGQLSYRRYGRCISAPEALYWAGVSRYKATNDASALTNTAREFASRYTNTTWAKKASVWNE